MGELERRLRAVRAGGGKAFVPYVTGGYPGVDADLLRAIADAGADAIEVGIPHSDPVMDGGVIQEASRVALEEQHTRPADVLAMVKEAGAGVPVAVMTYVNPIASMGFAVFCDALDAAGVAGVIVPDLPVDEAGVFAETTVDRGIDLVLLAAPGTSQERYEAIGHAAHGFVYCVATYGVTGARAGLDETARRVVEALRPHTDLPLLVGVGIATPEDAAEASSFADGVIVGSALMRALIEAGAGALVDLAAGFRAALPRA
jgi:tryptophan synthase alpha chain